MSSLFSSLYLGLTSLRAQQLGLSIAGNNVANINTPGYSRQRVLLAELDPLHISEGQLGRGVRAQDITSARDRFIETRLVQENQRLGQMDSMSQNLRQIEGVLADTGGVGIRDALSKFFNSFSDLANNPTNLEFRRQVLSAANNLSGSIRNAYGQLENMQGLVNQDVKSAVDQVNTLAGQIAALNRRVTSAEGLGQDSTALRDQRQVLLQQLGQLVNISHIENDNKSVTIQIGGRLLVAEGNATKLEAAPGAGSPFYAITMGGANITSEISSGKLSALLQVRDTNIPSYLRDLDTLAGGLITEVNRVHTGGADLSGAAGGNFFTPAAGPSAARSLSVAITDPARLAAAAVRVPPAPGDNTNARALAALGTTRIASLGPATFSEFYGGFAARVGNQSKDAADGFKTQKQLVRQIQNQRDAVSGVSLDEEMASIIQFQRAYEASARFVSLVNNLTEETMRLVGGR